MSEQRVYVTTMRDADGNCPTFLVHKHVRDVVISDAVDRRFGAQADGSGHLWEAHDVETIKQEGH
jgi:hypothetical protein